MWGEVKGKNNLYQEFCKKPKIGKYEALGSSLYLDGKKMIITHWLPTQKKTILFGRKTHFLELELSDIFSLMDFIFENEKGFLFVSDDRSNGIDGKDSGISTHLSVPNTYWKEAKEPTNKKKTSLMLKRAGTGLISPAHCAGKGLPCAWAQGLGRAGEGRGPGSSCWAKEHHSASLAQLPKRWGSTGEPGWLCGPERTLLTHQVNPFMALLTYMRTFTSQSWLVKTTFHCGLMHTSLIVSEMEHFFICMGNLNCPFMSFSNFSISLLTFFVSISRTS